MSESLYTSEFDHDAVPTNLLHSDKALDKLTIQFVDDLVKAYNKFADKCDNEKITQYNVTNE